MQKRQKRGMERDWKERKVEDEGRINTSGKTRSATGGHVDARARGRWLAARSGLARAAKTSRTDTTTEDSVISDHSRLQHPDG